jgi:H+-translocating NAD(P) transhydrogenase subunit alpha
LDVDNDVMLGAYIFLLAIFLGVELIGRVPATLHTPLMSGTNAIHGIVLLGAMIVLGQADPWWLKIIGFLAVILGAANVFGGFVVTDRMLEMFKRKPAAGGAGHKK